MFALLSSISNMAISFFAFPLKFAPLINVVATPELLEEWIFEKLFFRHVVDDAGIKSHADDRGIPIAFMVRCNDDGPGLWHILPPFDLEPEDDKEEEI